MFLAYTIIDIQTCAENSTFLQTFYQDLAVASPATVSRCGMVYVDPNELGWRPYVTTWLRVNMTLKLKEESRKFILDLFDAYLEDGLRFLRKIFIK